MTSQARAYADVGAKGPPVEDIATRRGILTALDDPERCMPCVVDNRAIANFSGRSENVRDRHRFSRHYVDGSSICAIEATGLVVDETKAPVRCIGSNGR